MKTLLIANRGEVVVRIARSAKALGLRTVAVYSAADQDAPYLASCDHAIDIGGTSAAESYLSIDKLLQACQQSGTDAVHPGYGFLSENPSFASAVLRAGLCWVGPPVDAMRIMADKAQAKLQAQRAGVPVLPGTAVANQDLQRLAEDAVALGFPLMIKASAGGGGRGMRLVRQASELPRALEGAHLEANAAFGDGSLLLERALLAPRHIEIQLMADAHGQLIHLGERDCSVQRRHQKLIEEAPSPSVDPALRRQLGEAALAIARGVNYVGLGTVEFLLDLSNANSPAFYFIEMNTRLQVEHPVTEALVAEDLVSWQLRIAAGEPLTLKQTDLLDRFERGGHAIEARLCAEDPAANHLPQSDQLRYWSPAATLRCEAALASGQWISPYYDSMLAKLIAHAPTRTAAIAQLADGLVRTVCLGVQNNRGFLSHVLRSQAFADGDFDTERLQRASPEFQIPTAPTALYAVGAWLLACLPRHSTDALPEPYWNWRSNGLFSASVALGLNDANQTWHVQIEDQTARVSDGTQHFLLQEMRVRLESNARSAATPTISAHAAAPAATEHVGLAGRGSLRLRLDGQPLHVFFCWEAHTFWLQHDATQIKIVDQRLQSAAAQATSSSPSVRAPMHGRIIQVSTADHDSVSAGQLLLIMEAMKMEHHLLAPCDARVEQILVRAGDQVASGQTLIVLG